MQCRWHDITQAFSRASISSIKEKKLYAASFYMVAKSTQSDKNQLAWPLLITAKVNSKENYITIWEKSVRIAYRVIQLRKTNHTVTIFDSENKSKAKIKLLLIKRL